MDSIFNDENKKVIRSKVVDGMGLADFIGNNIGNFTQVRIKDSKGHILYEGHNTTVLGGRMAQLEEIFGLQVNARQHLNLNDLLGIPHASTDDVYGGNIKRNCQYFMAGNGAASVSVANKYYKAKNYETNLYSPIPFRMVPVGNDLDDETRSKYRLRKIMSINDVDYIAYFAKKFEPGVLVLEYNGSSYSPLASDTTPVDENDASHRLGGGSVLAYIEFNLEIEQEELKEYFTYKNGSIDGAGMSEIGLVYGADVPNTMDSSRYELAAAELLAKITSNNVDLSSEASCRSITYRIYAR